jgi:hypothetical protein
MVTLLRKITRPSLSTKYLVYGTGEITLIVIGILIALGIDSWMEQRRFE